MITPTRELCGECGVRHLPGENSLCPGWRPAGADAQRTPKTDPRPMTPAESRALDALVEWRRAVARHAAALESDGTDHIDRADAADVAITCEDEMNAAADALVAEREVRRGA